ncbi:MAG: YggU family protein [Chloroflexi bacterium]|nr:MAG: YggU family protein [Chloroflexota bacterium]RLC91223.1 MAG: YggU family protein [Chloroflexota bacterium]
MTLRVIEEEGGCTFQVRVLPRGRRNEVVGLHGEALKIRLTAPPERGKANRALCEFLAERLGVPLSDIEILSGHTSRQKRVRVAGVSADVIRALLRPR